MTDGTPCDSEGTGIRAAQHNGSRKTIQLPGSDRLPIGIPMPAVYCEIIKHAVGPRVASELTLFGKVYDLAAAARMGIVRQTVASDKLLDTAIAWAALVLPDCYTAYAFSKRALQATSGADGRQFCQADLCDSSDVGSHSEN
jgi:enoyl-CoA hydratase/carnithine racemase